MSHANRQVLAWDMFRTCLFPFYTSDKANNYRDMPLQVSGNVRIRDAIAYQVFNLSLLDLSNTSIFGRLEVVLTYFIYTFDVNKQYVFFYSVHCASGIPESSMIAKIFSSLRWYFSLRFKFFFDFGWVRAVWLYKRYTAVRSRNHAILF